jgi:hypothetical protein
MFLQYTNIEIMGRKKPKQNKTKGASLPVEQFLQVVEAAAPENAPNGHAICDVAAYLLT